MSEQKASLIFIPLPVISHLLSTIKMAKLLADADHRLSITVLILKQQSPDNKIASYITNSPDSQITFIEVESPEAKSTGLFFDSHKGPIKATVAAVTGGEKLAGLFVDVLCISLIDVAAELGAPAFVFFTCGSAILGLMFHLQGLMSRRGHDQGLAEYKDSDAEVSVSTYVNPVPAKVWPGTVFQRDGGFYVLTSKLREASGIVVNTFLEIEPHAIEALAGDGGIPAVYPVGPLLQDDTDDGGRERAEILLWLDEQPDSSVVFLCFGTHGCFGEDQVKEIAVALERSGQRFLWSLRKPPPRGTAESVGEYENPGEVLPEGFL